MVHPATETGPWTTPRSVGLHMRRHRRHTAGTAHALRQRHPGCEQRPVMVGTTTCPSQAPAWPCCRVLELLPVEVAHGRRAVGSVVPGLACLRALIRAPALRRCTSLWSCAATIPTLFGKACNAVAGGRCGRAGLGALLGCVWCSLHGLANCFTQEIPNEGVASHRHRRIDHGAAEGGGDTSNADGGRSPQRPPVASQARSIVAKGFNFCWRPGNFVNCQHASWNTGGVKQQVNHFEFIKPLCTKHGLRQSLVDYYKALSVPPWRFIPPTYVAIPRVNGDMTM